MALPRRYLQYRRADPPPQISARLADTHPLDEGRETCEVPWNHVPVPAGDEARMGALANFVRRVAHSARSGGPCPANADSSQDGEQDSANWPLGRFLLMMPRRFLRQFAVFFLAGRNFFESKAIPITWISIDAATLSSFSSINAFLIPGSRNVIKDNHCIIGEIR